MDISTILGIVFGFGMLLFGYVLEEGEIAALILLSPAVIVFGGTMGTIFTSFTLKDVTNLGKFIKEAITLPKSNKELLLQFFMDLAQKARTEGLLSLEGALESGEFAKQMTPFIEKGIKLIIDGTAPELTKEILEKEIEVSEEELKVGIAMFEAAGGFAPTMGIIGTVMGLVKVLGNLEDPEALAESIAAAFIATLYGVSFANVVFLPLGGKLKLKMKREAAEKEFIIEGILSIQAGENPNLIKEKLLSFIDEKARDAIIKKEKSAESSR